MVGRPVNVCAALLTTDMAPPKSSSAMRTCFMDSPKVCGSTASALADDGASTRIT
jgi:hypothetical protein